MAKKLSVLKPRRLRNLYVYLSFSFYNCEETVTNFEKAMFRKESLTYKQTFKRSFYSDLHLDVKLSVYQ